MNENLPFEENMNEQLNKLQLPNEEQSWQKMKVLLDEDEKKRRPFFFWFNGILVGILLAGLATGAYFLFLRDDKNASVNNSSPVRENHSLQKTRQASKQQSGHTDQATSDKGSELKASFNDSKTENVIHSEENIIVNNNPPSLKKETVLEAPNSQSSAGKGKNKKPTVNSDVINVTATENDVEANDIKVDKKAEVASEEKTVDNITVQSLNTISDTIQENKRKPGIKDSAKRVRLKPEADSAKIDGSEVKYFFSAGIGIQQQIPIGGQGSVPYNVYGREASISDYIPSVFLRFHQEDKWFLMAEFRYGAPQKVKDFNYSQKSFYDTSSMILSTTTMRLKKTYYHQLPVSFNYYVKPGLSLGLGAMYSRFYGAVSEKEIRNENVFTQNVTYSKSISNVKGFTDSFLHKTQFHLVLNTDYQWKNFLLGFRFTKDLQPYIKYTGPDGAVNKEKNYSLQLIFRWQLWRSE